MEKIFVAGVIILLVFLQGLPSVIGYLYTPPGNVFLGTMHWPGDYFYYLSQFAQGKTHWFWSYDLYTNDFSKQTLVGWVNVFLGKVFSFVGISHISAYQLLVPILSVIFLYVSYLLVRLYYPGDPKKRVMAFLLFAFSNAFPKLEFMQGTWRVSFYEYWTNKGLTFNRLGGVPHHLIESIVIILIVLFVFGYWEGKRVRVWIKLLVYIPLGFVLVSIEPVHFLLIIFILMMTVCIWSAKRMLDQSQRQKIWIRLIHRKSLFNVLFLCLPIGLLLIGGMPMGYYLRSLFLYPPFIQLRVWENTQQIAVQFFPFLLATGPVALLSFIGLPMHVKKPTMGTLLGIVWIITTIGLFFSPIPKLMGISNARFIPATTILFLAIFATDGLYALEKLTKRTISVYVFFSITLLILLPTYWVQIGKRLTVQPDNAFYYIRRSAYDTFIKAKDMSDEKDTFLVIWPFNVSFPGITGRRVFEGHHLLTIDSDRKEKLTQLFFYSDTGLQEREKFINGNNIDYIVTYPWTTNIHDLSNIQKIYDSGYLAIYKVLHPSQ